jgi:hypothetical protein
METATARHAYEQARSEIIARPCTCYPCPECRGHGTVWYAFDGSYLGDHRCDDLDDLRHCDNCDGGVIEICDRCAELAEFDEAHES